MKKQIEGQISLFDYMAEEEKVHEAQDKPEIASQNTKKKKGQKTALSSVSFFDQCQNCWCSDCKHNEKLDAVPRDFSDIKKACPSCNFCLKDKKAEICEIGSYDNGCKLRASEEGIMPHPE